MLTVTAEGIFRNNKMYDIFKFDNHTFNFIMLI